MVIAVILNIQPSEHFRKSVYLKACDRDISYALYMLL